MDNRTADLLIQLLQALSTGYLNTLDKLYALEHMLDSQPETKAEYQRHLDFVRESRATQTNRESLSAVLDKLRAKLLQD
jgi:hypothetical protein